MRHWLLLFIAIPIFHLSGSSRAGQLFTIGPDGSVPRELTSLTTAGAPTPIGLLSDGSVGFNGGLAYRATDDRLYSAGTGFPVGSPQSDLYRFSAAGAGFAGLFDLTASAGGSVAFTGGLAYRPTDDAFYLVANDQLGASSFYRLVAGSSTLESLGTLGVSGAAGLTYNADDDKFYIVFADGSGIQRSVGSITPGPTPAVAPVFDLGDGTTAFNGGLAYDVMNDLFYVIANDSLASSSLDTFTLAGAGTLATVAADFGFGYLNASLALVPDSGTPAPEPPGIVLFAIAAIALSVARRRRSQIS